MQILESDRMEFYNDFHDMTVDLWSGDVRLTVEVLEWFADNPTMIQRFADRYRTSADGLAFRRSRGSVS